MFWGSTPPDPPPPTPLEKGDQWSLVETVGYSIQTYWLLLLLQPLQSLIISLYNSRVDDFTCTRADVALEIFKK